jgi:hypothetical protein
MKKLLTFLISSTLIVLLNGCGAGGVSLAQNAYNLNSGYHTLLTKGYSKQLTLTSTLCAGTVTLSASPEVAISTGAPLSGVPSVIWNEASGFDSIQQMKTAFTNCTPDLIWTDDMIVDSLGNSLGDVSVGMYGVTTSNTPLPSMVYVGSSGPMSTVTTYSDSTKVSVTGSIVTTYSFTSTSPTTANFALTVVVNNAQGALVQSVTTNFAVAQDGTMTLANAIATVNINNSLLNIALN